MEMKVVHTVGALKDFMNEVRAAGKKVGLVPTMGALHEGHLSLVKRSVNENDVTVVSIFVNPTQFNDKTDLEKYPRTLNEDCKLLERENVQLVFAPSDKEVYPEPDNRQFSYPSVDKVMEGVFRPGHFNGVCQIVSKLFEWIQPDRAYFGEKDFQQIAVIRVMVSAQGYPVKICACPIVRESDGLALSSRNSLLSISERLLAVNISKTLFESREYARQHTLEETQKWVCDKVNAIEGLKVQYYEIVDGWTLQKLSTWDDSTYVVGCITVFCGHVPVRLIDNVKYKEPNKI